MARCAKCNQEVTTGYVLCDRCYKKMDGIREDSIKEILGDNYDLDRLKELVEADKENRVISKNDLMGIVKLIANESVEEYWKIIEEETGIKRERLIHLAKADKEERCVVLPCKIGSKLYRTSMRKMQVYEVSVSREYFHDSKNKTTLFALQIFENGKKSTSYECFEEKDIGKTVFFTRKEAEAALEKMKEGDE